MNSLQNNNVATNRAARSFVNPLIRKLASVTETDSANACTYSGIFGKCLYFLIVTVIGLAAYFVIHSFLDSGLSVTVEGAKISYTELLVLAVCLVFTLITPLLSFLIRPVIPVAGTLYCAATGYLLSWLVNTFTATYAAPAWIALGLTLIIVAVMAFLYTSGKVKVTARFKNILSTFFLTAVFGGIIMFICSFIPGVKNVVTFVQHNAILTIGGSVLFIIIASLFLLVDFETIRNSVDGNVPKKYEWYASFGLVFTVIWLYMKIFNLIIQIQNKNN